MIGPSGVLWCLVNGKEVRGVADRQIASGRVDTGT